MDISLPSSCHHLAMSIDEINRASHCHCHNKSTLCSTTWSHCHDQYLMNEVRLDPCSEFNNKKETNKERRDESPPLTTQQECEDEGKTWSSCCQHSSFPLTMSRDCPDQHPCFPLSMSRDSPVDESEETKSTRRRPEISIFFYLFLSTTLVSFTGNLRLSSSFVAEAASFKMDPFRFNHSSHSLHDPTHRLNGSPSSLSPMPSPHNGHNRYQSLPSSSRTNPHSHNAPWFSSAAHKPDSIRPHASFQDPTSFQDPSSLDRPGHSSSSSLDRPGHSSSSSLDRRGHSSSSSLDRRGHSSSLDRRGHSRSPVYEDRFGSRSSSRLEGSGAGSFDDDEDNEDDEGEDDESDELEGSGDSSILPVPSIPKTDDTHPPAVHPPAVHPQSVHPPAVHPQVVIPETSTPRSSLRPIHGQTIPPQGQGTPNKGPGYEPPTLVEEDEEEEDDYDDEDEEEILPIPSIPSTTILPLTTASTTTTSTTTTSTTTTPSTTTPSTTTTVTTTSSTTTTTPVPFSTSTNRANRRTTTSPFRTSTESIKSTTTTTQVPPRRRPPPLIEGSGSGGIDPDDTDDEDYDDEDEDDEEEYLEGSGDIPPSGVHVPPFLTPTTTSPSVFTTSTSPSVFTSTSPSVFTRGTEQVSTSRPVPVDNVFTDSVPSSGGLPTGSGVTVPTEAIVPKEPTESIVPTGTNAKHDFSYYFSVPLFPAVFAGAIIGLLSAILLLMFLVYRIRRKDEVGNGLDYGLGSDHDPMSLNGLVHNGVGPLSSLNRNHHNIHHSRNSVTPTAPSKNRLSSSANYSRASTNGYPAYLS